MEKAINSLWLRSNFDRHLEISCEYTVSCHYNSVTPTGAVHVDVDAHNYISLMQAVIDRLTVKQDLPPDLQEYVMEALILRHSHQDGKPRFTRSKSYSNLMGLDSMTR